MELLDGLVTLLAAGAAWIVSTIGGGGGATLLVPVISFVLGARAVAPVVTLAAVVASPARVWLFRGHIDWRIVGWFLAGAVPGAVLGAWLMTGVRLPWLEAALGLFLVAQVLQLRRTPTSGYAARWMFLPAGLGVAVVSGLVGTVGPVLNALYLRLGILKEEMIGTKSVGSLAMHLAKIGTYTALGALDLRLLAFGLVAGIGAVAGTWVGKRWLQRFSDRRFKQAAVAVMVGSGLWMLWEQRALLWL